MVDKVIEILKNHKTHNVLSKQEMIPNRRISEFNELMRKRTLASSIKIYKLFKKKAYNDIDQSLIKQLIRSSTSVAANFNSATRGRSDAEFYSKICIVVEECAETQFWLNFILQAEILNLKEYLEVYNEVTELVKMFTSSKRKMKLKLGKN